MGIIKTCQKPFELFRFDRNDFIPSTRLGEAVLFQSLKPNAESVAVPVKNLYHVPSAVAEGKQFPGKSVVPYELLNHNGKSVYRFSHVGTADCQKNPLRLDRKHYIAATSRIRFGKDVTGALRSSSTVKPFG